MPSLGDELLTNARLVDGGAKVILVIIFVSCQSYVLLFLQ